MTTEELLNTMLNIKVYDENSMTAHVLIGSASISLRNLAGPGSFGKELDVPISLLGPKDQKSGRLILKAGLYKIEPKVELKVKNGFIKGILHVSKICGSELPAGGVFGDVSTYMIVKVPTPKNPNNPSNPNEPTNPTQSLKTGNENDKNEPDKNALTDGLWTAQTPTKTGSNPVWDYLDFKPLVTFDSLSEDSVTVECWVKTMGGMGGDKMVGSGTARMLAAGAVMVDFLHFK